MECMHAYIYTIKMSVGHTPRLVLAANLAGISWAMHLAAEAWKPSLRVPCPAQSGMYVCICVCLLFACMSACIHTHMRIQTCLNTDKWLQNCSLSYVRVCIHTHIQTCLYTGNRLQNCSLSCMSVCIHTPHTHTCMLVHERMYPHTHTHTHMCTYTHTYTLVYLQLATQLFIFLHKRM